MLRNLETRRLLNSKSNILVRCLQSSSSYGFWPSTTTTTLVGESPAVISKVRDAVRHYGQCYWELSKARLRLCPLILHDFVGLVFEKSNDARMNRTKKRPLPSGHLSVPHAAIWACSIGIAGTALLSFKANFLAAGLAASTLALYAFVYTPLKQIHPVNTWVGAVVGAIPPLLGWAAASGQISLNGMILPAALYFWQIPHFMALAYLCRSDYAAGGFRMISLTDASGRRTALVALRNSLYLLPLGYLAYDWGVTSGWLCLESGVLALSMTAMAFSFYRDRTTKGARRMFHGSLLYLPIFMPGLLVHRLTDNEQAQTETNLNIHSGLLFSETPRQETENDYLDKKRGKESSTANHARPPVAYASIAPFPFLPAPVYADSYL
ncbi:hypothetical protein IFM89_010127 [Coptis chinensis]|uniref:Heme O synthase n=1 Tax=Coptis chinensis TaxID=261450 RepID=A0A835I737_9MAGN|nr:hypothetical protein IFM89_010127 [Coptis chinensis]